MLIILLLTLIWDNSLMLNFDDYLLKLNIWKTCNIFFYKFLLPHFFNFSLEKVIIFRYHLVSLGKSQIWKMKAVWWFYQVWMNNFWWVINLTCALICRHIILSVFLPPLKYLDYCSSYSYSISFIFCFRGNYLLPVDRYHKGNVIL